MVLLTMCVFIKFINFNCVRVFVMMHDFVMNAGSHLDWIKLQALVSDILPRHEDEIRPHSLEPCDHEISSTSQTEPKISYIIPASCLNARLLLLDRVVAL